MDILTNNSMLLMESSMGFLWTKQTAILDNIVNAETPNYKAKVVTFEDTLRDKLESALSSARPKRLVRKALDSAEVTIMEARETARADGNGVDVTEQNVELLRNAYQLQYVMSSINTDLAILRSAVRGQ